MILAKSSKGEVQFVMFCSSKGLADCYIESCGLEEGLGLVRLLVFVTTILTSINCFPALCTLT